MSGDRIVAALQPVVEAFADLGIGYQVGGSVAASTFGQSRSTLDVDLAADVAERHAQPLAAALRGRYYADEEAFRDADVVLK